MTHPVYSTHVHAASLWLCSCEVILASTLTLSRDQRDGVQVASDRAAPSMWSRAVSLVARARRHLQGDGAVLGEGQEGDPADKLGPRHLRHD